MTITDFFARKNIHDDQIRVLTEHGTQSEVMTLEEHKMDLKRRDRNIWDRDQYLMRPRPRPRPITVRPRPNPESGLVSRRQLFHGYYGWLEFAGVENDGGEQKQTYILHPMKNFNVYDM